MVPGTVGDSRRHGQPTTPAVHVSRPFIVQVCCPARSDLGFGLIWVRQPSGTVYMQTLEGPLVIHPAQGDPVNPLLRPSSPPERNKQPEKRRDMTEKYRFETVELHLQCRFGSQD